MLTCEQRNQLTPCIWRRDQQQRVNGGVVGQCLNIGGLWKAVGLAKRRARFGGPRIATTDIDLIRQILQGQRVGFGRHAQPDDGQPDPVAHRATWLTIT